MMQARQEKQQTAGDAWLQTISLLARAIRPGDRFNDLGRALAELLEADVVVVAERRGGHEVSTDHLDLLTLTTRNDTALKQYDDRNHRLQGTLYEHILQHGRGTFDLNRSPPLPDADLKGVRPLVCGVGCPVITAPDTDHSDALICVLFGRRLTERESQEVITLLDVLTGMIASEINRMHAERWLKRARHYAEEGMQHSPVAMLITNRSGRIRQSNHAFRDLSGYFARDIMNWDVQYFFPDPEQELIEQCLDQLLSRQATHLNIESRILDWKYQTIEIDLDCYSLLDDDGEVRNIVFQLEDITARKQADRQIDRLLKSIELSPVATVITDHNAIIEYVNPRFNELTGFSNSESIGQKTNINSSGKTPRATYEAMWARILEGREWQGELLNRRKDGSHYWARTIIFPIIDQQGRITNFVSLQEDISEARRLSLKLEYEATHDQLTGLINRREFQRRLEQAIDEARVDEVTHALCFLDLDRFKVINDTSGHMAGDMVLRRIGHVLQEHIRANDTVARVGGDEFALILRHCDIQKAAAICDQVRRTVAGLSFPWDDQVFSVGLSAGLAVIDGQLTDTVELFKQVDAACYGAKDAGKNRVIIYSPGNRRLQQYREQSQWVPRLEHALAQRRFVLFAQPIYPLQQETALPHYEVLLRLRGDDGTLILPGEFLPTAERFGLAPRVDRMVFDGLYRFLTENASVAARAGAFSINLSGASISEPGLLRHIISTISRGNLPPELLQFEITETAAVTNINQARHFMQQLRGIGSRVVLDDFGRGLSSFAYLKNLPVDMLKIDGLFVREILEDRTDHTMVRMINELAHSLGMETIAEFIETAPVMDSLRQLGVDYGQGYHMARPAAITELIGRPHCPS